jgi:DNA polymerase-1
MDTHVVQSVDELREIVAELLKRKIVGYDVETTGLRPERGDRICGHALGALDGDQARAWYVPVRHSRHDPGGLVRPDYDEFGDYHNLDPAEVARVLRPLLGSRDVPKAGAFLQFDRRMCAADSIDLVELRDAQALTRICRPDLPRVEGERTRYGLKALKRAILGDRRAEERDALEAWLVDNGLPRTAYHLAPIGLVAGYAGADAVDPLRLIRELKKDVAEDVRRQRERGKDPRRRGFTFLWRLENRLAEVVADMEGRGFPVDVAHFEAESARLEAESARLTREIREEAGKGEDWNPLSDRQLAAYLYGELGLPRVKLTGKGNPSVDREALERLRSECSLVGKILDLRWCDKLRSTWVGGELGVLRNTVDGRVYSDIRPDGAVSGRLSSSLLMTLPPEVRRGFVVESPDWRLVSMDLKQIEPRLLAHFSGSRTLARFFREGGDVYRRVAALALRKPADDVTGDERTVFKRTVLGIIYGLGAATLARRLSAELGREFTLDEARATRAAVYRAVPELRPFQDRCRRQVEARGWISTLFGRRRRFPAEKSYVGVNHVIQGSAADLFKLAILRCARVLEGRRSRMLVPLHDELVFMIHRSEAWILFRLADAMTRWGDLFGLPIECDVEVSSTHWEAGRELSLADVLETGVRQMMVEERELLERAVGSADDLVVLRAEARVAERYPELAEDVVNLRRTLRAFRRGRGTAGELFERALPAVSAWAKSEARLRELVVLGS